MTPRLVAVLLVLAATASCSTEPRSYTVPESTATSESGSFPDATTTGVPEGSMLQAYDGPLIVEDAGTVIDGYRIEGALIILAPDVVVSRSLVVGSVGVEESGSLQLSDSTVDAGTASASAVGQFNLTMRRVEVVGGRQSVSCLAHCDIQDSWLHGQFLAPDSDWHGNGFVSNGGHHMVLRNNTLACDAPPTGGGGACSAALSVYGDFAPITDLVVDGNLFVAGPAGYCMYGGYDPLKPHGADTSRVSITDNVFERGKSKSCGVYGPITAVAPPGEGLVFSGNTWDDGNPVDHP